MATCGYSNGTIVHVLIHWNGFSLFSDKATWKTSIAHFPGSVETKSRGNHNQHRPGTSRDGGCRGSPFNNGRPQLLASGELAEPWKIPV